jgi:hypothetical protein
VYSVSPSRSLARRVPLLPPACTPADAVGRCRRHRPGMIEQLQGWCPPKDLKADSLACAS